MNKEEFIKNTFAKYDIKLNQSQIDKFLLYFEFLVEENKKYNLTAITDFEEVVYKHFLDSALSHNLFKENSTVIDIGSGAGFPGVPLKILRDDLKITLIDSLQKRVNFLNQLILKLNLKNIVAYHDRAEDFCLKNREKFDYALSRAVAQVSTLSEYLLPFLKIGGKAIMYKSQKLNEELELGKNSIKVLGGKIEKCENFIIKEISSERNLLIIDKIKSTPPIYPRGKNFPKTKPIQ